MKSPYKDDVLILIEALATRPCQSYEFSIANSVSPFPCLKSFPHHISMHSLTTRDFPHLFLLILHILKTSCQCYNILIRFKTHEHIQWKKKICSFLSNPGQRMMSGNWSNNHQTSNGSWCIGIKGEMSGTVCVTFIWDIYRWVVYSFCLFCCLIIIVTWWYMWCIVWQVASKRKYRHVC